MEVSMYLVYPHDIHFVFSLFCFREHVGFMGLDVCHRIGSRQKNPPNHVSKDVYTGKTNLSFLGDKGPLAMELRSFLGHLYNYSSGGHYNSIKSTIVIETSSRSS